MPQPSPPDRPKSSENEKRDRILAAAEVVCREVGFEATRMDAIARRAGVSKGTLYNFFPSKHDLFVETVLRLYQGFVQILPTVEDPAADPRDRLVALIESLARAFPLVADHLLLAQQAWSVVVHSPDARKRLFGSLQEIYQGWTDNLRDILLIGVERGIFPPDLAVDVFASTWIAVYDGLLYRAGFNEPDPDGPCSTQGVRAALGLLLDQLDPPEIPSRNTLQSEAHPAGQETPR